MLLSDRDILAEVTEGRIALEPWDPAMLQPSSIDVRLDRFFRVFENHTSLHTGTTAWYIMAKQELNPFHLAKN